ncbi:MAG: exodeoxyribonuclease VII small subunit [Clostridia bacterium]|nr:exodeoxyribonuclease VII small subunit [Clostridia bacterium]
MNIDEQMTFEAAMARLEEIVHLLESGNAPLDVSLSLYEEGVALVRLCNTRLDNAQKRVKILTVGSDGNFMEEDMPPMQGGEKIE